MMDNAYNAIKGKGRIAAENALLDVLYEIEVKVKNCELKPYNSKEVYVPPQ